MWSTSSGDAMKIVKGDTVNLLAGKDKANGKNTQGKVIRVMPEAGKIVVEGLNMVTKHQRPRATSGSAQLQQGGRIQLEAPIPVSRVMLVCTSCGKPTRVGMKVRQDTRNTLAGTKIVNVRDRVCKHCDAIIPRPTE